MANVNESTPLLTDGQTPNNTVETSPREDSNDVDVYERFSPTQKTTILSIVCFVAFVTCEFSILPFDRIY